jgi:hypothetical protein
MTADDREQAWLFHYQRGVISREQALASGLTPVSPRQLRTEPDRIVGDIAAALRTGRPVAGIITVPAAA